jgi:hypothetical protein
MGDGVVWSFVLDHVIESIVLTSFGCLTFLVRHFFSSIQKEISKLGGRFDSLDERSDKHHTKIAVMENEMRAIWRTLDPPRRMSDHINGGDEE